MTRFHNYDQNYRRKCFDAWYLAGRPNLPSRIREIIPEFDGGRKPTPTQIGKWIIDGMWDERADELDARAEEKADISLINKKAQLLIKHQQNAAKISEKALNFLLSESKFDSSASAVTAYFRATEEERKTQGFSDLLERLDKMTNNDVEREIREKVMRLKENNQGIENPDTVSEDVIDADTE